jgi:PD-(D/E)XK nuclease superfamily protein
MSMTTFTNSKKQGDWGLGRAIAYFTLNEYTVSLPLTESQDYDLIVDKKKLQKVQVKTTEQISKKTGFPIVSLRTCGGNRSRQIAKNFDPTKVDAIFVTTVKHGDYFIPTERVWSVSTLTLDKRFDDCKADLNQKEVSMGEFMEELVKDL